MKVIYNTKEIGDNRNNYNRLTEKPLINGVELVGNITLNDINVYTKEEVKKLISSARSVQVKSVKPSPLAPNTTYYIGPDMHGIYSVWLTDSADPINVFQIGTTSFGKYYSGEGINVTDPSNIVSVLVDSESVILNSEGLMEARPVFKKMVPFNGATATKDGSKGIVPKPVAGDQNKFLFGDCTWKSLSEICDIIHPVGSLFITSDSSSNPNNLWPGTTWTQLSNSYTLMTDATGGSTVSSGLPNVKGNTEPVNFGSQGSTANWSSKPFAFKGKGTQSSYGGGRGWIRCDVNIDLSRASAVYGRDSTTVVRPPSYTIRIWRRTA